MAQLSDKINAIRMELELKHLTLKDQESYQIHALKEAEKNVVDAKKKLQDVQDEIMAVKAQYAEIDFSFHQKPKDEISPRESKLALRCADLEYRLKQEEKKNEMLMRAQKQFEEDFARGIKLSEEEAKQTIRPVRVLSPEERLLREALSREDSEAIFGKECNNNI